MSLLWVYKKSMTLGEPVIRTVLRHRARKGKEDTERLGERRGIAGISRPDGPIVWVHVASVGEAQSMLSLIELILSQQPNVSVLVTSITTTSAQLLKKRLPARAFHQYVPVDHPDWVRRFLDHWRPDLVLWAESELWPNVLTMLKKRNIPTALLNAHMSEKSFSGWSKVPRLAEDMLAVFMVILAQTKEDAEYYTALGGRSVVIADNIKYSAAPLPCDEIELSSLRQAVGDRPMWLYASTHAGEEALACRTHLALLQHFPDLLTIIAPRHPARRDEIAKIVRESDLSYQMRGEAKTPPSDADQVYIADTMGELGLFYRLAPMACVGRSFSDDGGGGHNPIEPAILDCAVLHGPHVQNLERIYAEMAETGAAIALDKPDALPAALAGLLSSPEALKNLQDLGYAFACRKTKILSAIIRELEPAFLMANLPILKETA